MRRGGERYILENLSNKNQGIQPGLIILGGFDEIQNIWNTHWEYHLFTLYVTFTRML